MILSEALLVIDGERRAASDGRTFEVRGPLSEDVVCLAASASADDCLAAVESAARAFDAWEKTPLAARRDVFLRAATLLAAPKYNDLIVKTVMAETGSAREVAAVNVSESIVWAQETAAMASRLKGETIPSVVPGGQCIVQRRAHGVVLCISPWNAPVNLTVRSIAPAILCGNTVVLKSSEASPASQAIVVELLEDAGLPKGVLNYINVCREDAPGRTAELIAHPLVRKITFTGSTRIGKVIAGEAAKHLKPCVLELGGKAPAVVLEDADIASAARSIITGAMLHAGQICMSTERVIVQRAVASPLLHALVENANAWTPVPSISPAAAARVVDELRDAVAAGARVVAGDLAHAGALVRPHVLVDVDPAMRAWTEESFGPVVVVAVVDTAEEAVRLANATEHSFTGAVWTAGLYRALDVAARMRFGAVMINGSTLHTEPGLDHAGLGGPTGYGRFDIDHFTDKRLIVVCPTENARL